MAKYKTLDETSSITKKLETRTFVGTLTVLNDDNVIIDEKPYEIEVTYQTYPTLEEHSSKLLSGELSAEEIVNLVQLLQ